MDRDNSPGALDAELFEEGCSNDGLAGSERIWVEKSAANDTDEDDGESSPENLRAISDHSSSSHRSKVCDYLRYCDGIGAKFVLIG